MRNVEQDAEKVRQRVGYGRGGRGTPCSQGPPPDGSQRPFPLSSGISGPEPSLLLLHQLANGLDIQLLARLPKNLPFSGQSMPLRRMRSGWWLCKTSMVSPSRMETTGPVKSDASTAEKEEMKKHKVDTEGISSLRLRRVYLEVP